MKAQKSIQAPTSIQNRPRWVSSGLHFENPLLNSKKGHIESSATKIEDEDITSPVPFLLRP